MKLNEITNIAIREETRKLSSNVYEFVACLLCEYALGVLHYDKSDDRIFPVIQRYLVGGETTAKALIMKLGKDSEIQQFLSVFPDIEKQSKDSLTEWKSFFEKSGWNSFADKNEYTFNGQTYEMPNFILSVNCTDGNNFAQRYIYRDRNHLFVDIGSGEHARPARDHGILTVTGENTQISLDRTPVFTVSEDEFFSICDIARSADKEQKAAIVSDIKKNLVILAGAGSGKTRTLVCRLAYLHLVYGIPLEKIMLLTFTTSAASEMKKRSLEILEPIYAKYSPLSKPAINARTIDSFIIGLIDSYYTQIGFDNKPKKYLEDNGSIKNEKLRLLEEIIEENHLQGVFKYYYDLTTGRPNAQFEWLLKNLIDYANGLPINAAGFDTLLDLYLQKQKDRCVLMGFTEASLFVKQALYEENSALKEIIENRYSAILIDEFQDVSSLQNSIFSPFYSGDIHFTYVGDDDQSIYYWRGSDNSIIRSLVGRPDTDTVYLLTNYRNNPNIVEAGNCVLATIKDRAKAEKPIIPYRKNGAKIRLATYDERYLNLVAEVSRLLQDGQPENEICILSRSTAEANAIARALGASGIVVKLDKLRIDSDENYALMKAIFCILNNTDVTESINQVERITNTTDVTEKHIYRVITGQCEEYECEASLKNVKELADEIRLSQVRDMADAVNRYAAKANELFEDTTNGKYSGNVYELFESHCEDNQAPWPISKQQLRSVFSTFEVNAKKDVYLSSKPNEKGVRVSTIHASKGLEYNVVIITGLALGQYPDTEQIDKVYAARNSQLNTLKGSKAAYYALKAANRLETYSRLLEACNNSMFSPKEKGQIEQFREEIQSQKGNLLMLNADGVENYLDSYRSLVAPLEKQYLIDINEQKRIVLIDQAELEDLQQEEQLLYQDGEALPKEKMEEESQAKERIKTSKRKIEKIEYREKLFRDCIRPIKEFYNTCITANGFLTDMEKAEELERLKEELEKERNQRINEERRLFYVAITRARDYLYLCHSHDSSPSEFISLIRPALTEQREMLTREEEEECRRLLQAVEKETVKTNVDDSKVDEATESLFEIEKVKTYTKQKTREFHRQHPEFAKLHGEAGEYFTKALSFLFLQELLCGNYQTEIAHNLQRTAEKVLSNYAGKEALSVNLSENETDAIDELVNDIREVTKGCRTGRPSPKYIEHLLTEPDVYHDNLQKLKSAGIMHYLLRSGKFGFDEKTEKSWARKEKLKDPEKFLVSAMDLANVRNALIHNKLREGWPEDPVPQMIDNLATIVSECT